MLASASLLLSFFEPLNKIIDNESGCYSLYLGNMAAANDKKILRENNIKAVLTIASGLDIQYDGKDHIIHLVIEAFDIDSYNISQHFPETFAFIQENLQFGKNSFNKQFIQKEVCLCTVLLVYQEVQVL